MKNLKSVILVVAVAFYSISAMSQDLSKTRHLAVCILYPTQDNKVTGTIRFSQVTGGVMVVAEIQGLTPGKHGIHIHECGDCTAPDGTSAGGHFNPKTMNHGSPTDAMRHEGDMGNIVADASGNAHLEYVDKTMTLDGDASIVGRSVIIHQKEDDMKTQPTGNAGARIACGVIGIAK